MDHVVYVDAVEHYAFVRKPRGRRRSLRGPRGTLSGRENARGTDVVYVAKVKHYSVTRNLEGDDVVYVDHVEPCLIVKPRGRRRSPRGLRRTSPGDEKPRGRQRIPRGPRRISSAREKHRGRRRCLR